MRPRLLLFLLLATLAAPASAGGGGVPPTPTSTRPERELFYPDTVFQSYPGERVPFTVEVDLSRSRTMPSGPVRVMVVAVTPNRWTLNLVSRPVTAGEKVRWKGTLPKAGVLVVNVLGGYGSSSLVDTVDRIDSALTLTVTGDARGSLRVR